MSYLPHPTDLGYFLEIASRKNLSRAAERLGIQQPTLSLALKRLEEGFEIALVVREKHGVSLTDAGKRLVEKAQLALNQWQQLSSDVGNSEVEVSGLLRIGAHASVARYALPKSISEMSFVYPKLRIQLVHELSRTIQSMLLERTLDCGLIMNPNPHPDLVMIPILEDEVSIFIAKNCKNPDLLIVNLDLHQMQTIRKKLSPSQFPRTLECTNLEVIARLTHEGCGAGVLPQRIADLLSNPPLKRIAGAPVVKDKLYFCYSVSSRSMKSVIALKKLLLESNFKF